MTSNLVYITDNMLKTPIDLNNKNNKYLFKQEKTIRNAFVLTGNINSPRYCFVKNLLSKIGFTVVPVIYIKMKNKDGALSNKVSMLEIYKIITASPQSWNYVFEDDINTTIKHLTLEYIMEYEKASDNFYFLGICEPRPKIIKSNNYIHKKMLVKKKGFVRGLHAIGFETNKITKFINYINSENRLSKIRCMDQILEGYSRENPANVARYDLKSPVIKGHKGIFFQDRSKFKSMIS